MSEPILDVGDTVAVDLDLLSGGRQQRRSGKVTEVHRDGQITAEFPQGGHPPLTVSGPGGHFIPVRTTPGEEPTRQRRIVPDRSNLGDLIVMHGPYEPYQVVPNPVMRFIESEQLNALRAELIQLRDFQTAVMHAVEDGVR